MTISVAMCTYNGAKYIREQLDSIIQQTKSVDEIVICDDGSTDETVSILNEYVQNIVSPRINVYLNNKPLGCVKNFEKAINCCQGELVFLADQDDVWRDDKVQVMYDCFDRNEKITCVFSDGHVIGDDGSDLHETIWNLFGFGPNGQQLFRDGYGAEVIARSNVATGATMAIKKTKEAVVLPVTYYQDGRPMYHDEYLILMSALENCAIFINEPLISYRMHAGQASQFTGTRYHEDDVFVPSKHQHAYDNYPLSKEQRKRMDFSLNRYNIARSIFGWRLWAHMVEYIVRYKGYAKRFFLEDLKECKAYHQRKIKKTLSK